MDKVSQLKTMAKVLAAGGAIGASGTVLASNQIASNKRSARSKKGWETRRSILKTAGIAPLVGKVSASGYHPAQVKRPKVRGVSMGHRHSLTTSDTRKGDNRAFVSRNAMPVSFEPEHAPKSKTMSQLRGGIGRV